MHTRRLTCTTKKSTASGSAGSRSCEAWYYNKLHAGLKTAALFVFQRGREKRKRRRSTARHQKTDLSVHQLWMKKKITRTVKTCGDSFALFMTAGVVPSTGLFWGKQTRRSAFSGPTEAQAQERRDVFFLMWTCERQTVPTFMGFKGAKKVQLRLEISWNQHKVQTWWIQLLSSCSSWAESLKQLHLSGRLYFKFKVCRPVESRSLWFLSSYTWKRHG